MKVLVTGGNGFVGRHVLSALSLDGIEAIGAVRRKAAKGEVEIDFAGDLRPVLKGFDAVVHTAGVAHEQPFKGEALEEAYRQGNFRATESLAEGVRDSSVRMLIHVSSIAAAGRPGPQTATAGLKEDDDPGPSNAYGLSKRLAEEPVLGLEGSGKIGINLRPPLIYGSGARGNWPKLLKLVRSPLPLPFGAVCNRRSYLGIDNLCDLVVKMLSFADSASVSGTYHVADSDVVSLREIVIALRKTLDRGPLLVPFPPAPMREALCVLGREGLAEGLFGDLIVDATRVRETFAWTPKTGTLEGMAKSLGASHM